MSHMLLELILWSLVVFVIGCLAGSLLRQMLGAGDVAIPAAAAAAAARVAMPEPKAEMPAYAPPKPVAPLEPDVMAPIPAVPAMAPLAAAAEPVMAAATVGRSERPKGIAKARGGKADNLQRISGVGPKNERVLHNLGFFHFDQIAEWTGEQVAWVDDHLKFNGRIKREEWKRQARLLADGKEDEFTRLYGTGGLKNKAGEAKSGSRTRRK